MSRTGSWVGVIQGDECRFQFIEGAVREFFEVHGSQLGFGVWVSKWREEVKFEFENQAAFEAFDGGDVRGEVWGFCGDGEFSCFTVFSFDFFDGFELSGCKVGHRSIFRSVSGSKSELTSFWFTQT